MTSLRKLVDGSDTLAGRVFDYGIQLLIVISLVAFSVETLPDLSNGTRHLLKIVEIVIVVLFTAEYLLRVYYAENRLKFMTSFFGIIDLIAILPFYLASGMDLRSIRVFRLLRLFRLFKLVRYSEAAQRFHKALVLAREEIILFLFVTLLLIYLAAVGIYYFENPVQPETFQSIFHSLWWAVVTLTTVGYGDAYPITVGGRIFTFVILLIGLGIVSVPAGLVSSALSEAKELEKEQAALEGNRTKDATDNSG
ncbi:MAG: ion transporter [Granulosicoccus sp.]|nr:ion transporter [Granulosicoccus sp.]